jgi:hypothetical protein
VTLTSFDEAEWKVTAAVLLDYDSLVQSNFTLARADDTRYGVKLLINF